LTVLFFWRVLGYVIGQCSVSVQCPTCTTNNDTLEIGFF